MKKNQLFLFVIFINYFLSSIAFGGCDLRKPQGPPYINDIPRILRTTKTKRLLWLAYTCFEYTEDEIRKSAEKVLKDRSSLLERDELNNSAEGVIDYIIKHGQELSEQQRKSCETLYSLIIQRTKQRYEEDKLNQQKIDDEKATILKEEYQEKIRKTAQDQFSMSDCLKKKIKRIKKFFNEIL